MDGVLCHEIGEVVVLLELVVELDVGGEETDVDVFFAHEGVVEELGGVDDDVAEADGVEDAELVDDDGF